MGPPEGEDERIRRVETEGMAAVADAVVERRFTPEFRAGSADAAGIALQLLLATSPAGYAGCCAAIRDMDLRPTAALIKAPTLIIAGSSDPATPIEHSEELAEKISGASLRTLRAAHLSNFEQPAAFLKAIQQFLD